MQIFQVGGAVRDRLLDRPVQDSDWVVVGATAEDMRALGFRQVGRDFPVFLHPGSGEEYALARRERKSGPGHHGFAFDTSREVTLQEDLERRDLTINAMALAADGTLIDPFGGRRDLEQRVLRHVSPAFVEDPLRVLRVARFAARLHALGFSVAPQTLELMRRLAASGELETLVPERVWSETRRALAEDRPDVFFSTLRECGALAVLFPEVEALFGVPQPERWHPEIDTGVHLLLVLREAARLSPRTEVRFAALTHDLGKAETPRELWPSHPGHEQRSVRLARALCERLRVPTSYRELAEHVAARHGAVHRAAELRPTTVLRVIEEVDGLRRPERLEDFLLACEADARGRTGLAERPYPQADWFRAAAAAARAVDSTELRAEGLEGPALGHALRRARQRAVREVLREVR